MEFREAVQKFLNGEIVFDASNCDMSVYQDMLGRLADQGVYFYGQNKYFEAMKECFRYSTLVKKMFTCEAYYYETEMPHIPIIDLRDLYHGDLVQPCVPAGLDLLL